MKGLRETKNSRNLALQEMQGYQWDSHHQHHAPAQAYPTAKQMEGKSLQSSKFSFYFLTPFGVRLKRKYPLTIAAKIAKCRQSLPYKI